MPRKFHSNSRHALDDDDWDIAAPAAKSKATKSKGAESGSLLRDDVSSVVSSAKHSVFSSAKHTSLDSDEEAQLRSTRSFAAEFAEELSCVNSAVPLKTKPKPAPPAEKEDASVVSAAGERGGRQAVRVGAAGLWRLAPSDHRASDRVQTTVV